MRKLFLAVAVLFTINTFAQKVVVRRTAVEDNGRAFIDTDLQYRFTVDFESNTVTRDKGAKHKPIYEYNLDEVYTEGDIKYKWTAYEGSYISQLGIRVDCMIIEYRQKDEFTGDALIKKFYGRIKD